MKKRLWLRIVLVGAMSTIFSERLGASPIQGSEQLVVVVTPSWTAVSAELKVYERENEAWVLKLSAPAVVGSRGLGWGVGRHSSFVRPGASDPIKNEGDKRAPAGAFDLVETFGYEPLPALKGAHPKLPQYFQVTEHSRCVDDYKSRYYNNQIYDERGVEKDWDSHEKLRREDGLYKLAVVVDHNRVNVRDLDRSEKRGSCIFLHLWRGPGEGTLGCTAMTESVMRQVYGLLDVTKRPVLVQLPLPVYQSLAETWKLP